MRNVHLNLVASLVVFIAATSPAAAQPAPAPDRKNYPGAACLASQSDILSIERPAASGRAFNTAGATRTVVCPAIKDAASIMNASAWVINRRPNTRLACYLRTGQPNSLVVLSATNSTSAASPNPVLLNFPGLGAVATGFYWLACDLPGTFMGQRSGIVTYSINEAPPAS